ncbi:MAG: GNAT family N-acetyltransferase [Pseudomonadota bacterium]|nr:GNAT family N-acetyltransferase [Pseudomonadota bacterium]
MTIRNLDFLLRPRRIVICGAPRTASHRQILANLERSKPVLQRYTLGFDREGWGSAQADTPPIVELGIVFEPDSLPVATLGRLIESGCRALLWGADEAPSQAVLEAARPQLVRILGPRSGGVAWPGLALNATAYEQPIGKGRVALIAQSSSVAAAALDWAAGRELGFSWVAVTGGEADVDIGDLLDTAAVDPISHAVVLQMSRLKSARKFMSAARACARNKPVLVLQTPPHGIGLRDPVRSAALQRAGLIESEVLGGLFDGIAALERLPNQQRFRVIVAGNGAGVCALGLAAIGRHGLQYTDLAASSRTAISGIFAGTRFLAGSVDLCGAPPESIARIVRALSEDPGVDSVLLMHSPRAGQPHDRTAQAVAELGLGARVLTVWLGLETALQARAYSSEMTVPTFASADEAMRALRYRQQYRSTQELLMQTPPPLDLPQIDREKIRGLLEAAARHGKAMEPALTAEVMSHYGLSMAAGEANPTLVVEVAILRHEEFGQYLRVRGSALWSGRGEAYGFAPLDPLLARRLLEDAGVVAAMARRGWDAAGYAAVLVHIGQMLVDQPAIANAVLRLAPDARGLPILLPDSTLTLTDVPEPPRRRLALAPYPADLTQGVTLKQGREFHIRVVRPADETAVIRLLERSDPENIRLRFFGYIRQFSHAMAARLTQLDYDREIAFVAIPRGTARIVALAHLMADPDAGSAEFSLLVHQDFARVGLGRFLLGELVHHGRRQGIHTVFGEILAENRPMLSLARALGFTVRHAPHDPGSMHAEIQTGAPAHVQ